MKRHTSIQHRLLALCLLILVVSLGCGCAYLFRGARGEALGKNPPNPFHDIKKVAITPFATDQAMQSVPLERSLTYSEALASELAQFPGFEVFRAYRQASEPKPQSGYDSATAKVTGAESQSYVKDLDVDAVIIGSITEYDPYTPRIGVTLTLIRTRQPDSTRRFADLELLAQRGKPLVVTEPETGEVLAIRVERIFDSRQDAVKNALARYAATRASNGSPAGADQYRWESNYIQFVSNAMIRELLKTATEHDKKKPRD
jgi:hypothetical protein